MLFHTLTGIHLYLHFNKIVFRLLNHLHGLKEDAFTIKDLSKLISAPKLLAATTNTTGRSDNHQPN